MRRLSARVRRLYTQSDVVVARPRARCGPPKFAHWATMASSWRLQRAIAARELIDRKRGGEACLQTSFKEKEVKNELNTIGGTGRGPIGAGGPALTRRAGGVPAGVSQSRLKGKHRFCVLCRFWWPVTTPQFSSAACASAGGAAGLQGAGGFNENSNRNSNQN